MNPNEAAAQLNDGREHLVVFEADPQSPMYVLPKPSEIAFLNLMLQSGVFANPAQIFGCFTSVLEMKIRFWRPAEDPILPATKEQFNQALSARDIKIFS